MFTLSSPSCRITLLLGSRQEVRTDAVSVRKGTQYLDSVVAYGEDGHAGVGILAEVALQLTSCVLQYGHQPALR